MWLEIGWFWGHRGRDRVIVLTRGKVEIPSDYQGVQFYEYKDDPTERASDLVRYVNAVRRR